MNHRLRICRFFLIIGAISPMTAAAYSLGEVLAGEVTFERGVLDASVGASYVGQIRPAEVAASKAPAASLTTAPAQFVRPLVTPLPTRSLSLQRHRGISVAELLDAPPMTFLQLAAKTAAKNASPGNTGLPTILPKITKVAQATQIAAEAGPKVTTVIVRIADKAGSEPTSAPVTLPQDNLSAAQSPVPKAMLPVLSQPRGHRDFDPLELSLKIEEKNGELQFVPKSLHFTAVGQRAAVQLKVAESSLNIFVRDRNALEWTSATKNLVARAKGATELYIVAHGKMYIVPIVIDGKTDNWNLSVPNALVSLDGVFSKELGSLTGTGYPGAVNASLAVRPDSSISLRDSVEETRRSQAAQQLQTQRYQVAAGDSAYRHLTIQFIDDRSDPNVGLIYPLGNLHVSLTGTAFSAVTDATGHLSIQDMPARSRFFVTFDDPEGRVRAGIAELITDDDSRVVRIKAMREFSFDSYTKIAGVVQSTELGSVCGKLSDSSAQDTSLAGVALSLDVNAAGPYYFNKYGFLDRTLSSTGEDGRFCFFNVLPGPVALSVFNADDHLATVPLSIFAGRHSDEVIDIGLITALETRLATMPTAHEQLGSDTAAATTYRTIDMADLIPLGSQTAMVQVDDGKVATSAPVLNAHGRVFALSQAAEFESVLYSYSTYQIDNGTSSLPVTPLLPRGFVEDMALYAQVAQDPQLGVVLAEHMAFKGQEGETINMRLVDEAGRDVGTGWYYNDAPVTRAIFFNVPSGTYTLLVETVEKYWLAADTVLVYNETVSYTHTGSMLRFRP